jgi:hypothetical protein
VSSTCGDPDDYTETLAHLLGNAAVDITGLSPYFVFPNGRSRGLLLLDLPIPPLTIAGTLPVLPRLMSAGRVHDGRTSLWNVGRLAGWQLAWSGADFAIATFTDTTGTMTAEFDELSRITRLAGSLDGSSSTQQ